MKRLLFVLLIICLVIATTSYATEVTVSNENELFSAFQDASIDIVKLGANITLNVELENSCMPSNKGIEIDGIDRTIDFNGYSIYLDSDEQIRINYRSGNNITFTNNSATKVCGIFGTNVDRPYYYSAFDLYNYTSNDVGMIINGGYFVCISDSIVQDTNHFMLTINDGWFEYGDSLLEFSNSFASDFIINKAVCKIYNGDEESNNRIVYGKFSDDYLKTKLGTDSYLFKVDSLENYTEDSVNYVTKSYKGYRLEILPENEAPVGSILPAIPNVIFENEVLTWGEFEDDDLDHYYFSLANGGGSIYPNEERTFDAKDWIIYCGKPSGRYYLKIWAEDSSHEVISRKYVFIYDYESDYPQLATPQNLRWEDTMTAAWDAVEDATNYEVLIYRNSTSGSYSFIKNTPNNYIDFSGDKRFSTDVTYYFRVYAQSDANPESDGATVEEGKTGWFVKGDLTNVHLSANGLLTWDAYEGAENYHFSLGSGGGSTNEHAYINLKEMARSFGFTQGNEYTYKVKALITVDGTECDITNEYVGTYTYREEIPGDFTEDGELNIYDVRLLLQTTLTIDNPTAEDLAKYDLTGDGYLNVLDVRLLLQMVIGMDHE